MILLAGIPSEPPLALVIESAEDEFIEYVLFNQRDSHFTELFVNNSSGDINGSIRIKEQDWDLTHFSGVYARMMDYRELPENRTAEKIPLDHDKVVKSVMLHELFTAWLEVADCRVCNRASDMNSNMSKPYQSQLIVSAGFKIPITLISNNLNEVKSFKKNHGRVIYKSTSAIRSIVKQLDAVKLLDLKNIESLPTQFQAYVPGENIRVHVVGDVLFPTLIKSEAVDYRYASSENLEVNMIPIQLPEVIENACFELSRKLRLPLCGIDLKKTPENEYYCFEVNPSPGYSYFQQTSGQDISGAIVRYLEKGSAKKQ